MAIVKIVGQVDGEDIIFSLNPDGDWIATVPKALDGEYVVEVKAYDEAGNMSYSSSMLFTVDPATLEVEFIPLQYAYKTFENDPYSKKIIVSEFAYYVVSPRR
ncbi:PF13754 domain-containing protein [Schinkia azotoformans]|uniref:PF13754 domain-containing protein n=1 Tax=Schinkia azotoformans TaxID=1454 RepID=UPI002DB711CF|nr:PF13754 domain-containing protein [Schinkia azotoformans]MEC1744105.1 PF13754 domain-containing protein [Schinkia azotoformans]